MKKIIIFICFLQLSCISQQEKRVSKIKVNFVSLSIKTKGHIYEILEANKTVVKSNEQTILIYHFFKGANKNDTLKLYKNGVIEYKNITLKKVDEKKIMNKGKLIKVHKLYISNIGDMSVDNFSGQIIYLANDDIIAIFGVVGNYASLYNPEMFSEIHNKILYNKIDFKRDSNELDGRP
ncbi:hypothetical protein [Flavobacterium sp.]|uniref:hypothetical protein n=1 Tax=Flavobacterium sp. TaxID=239 RepID=UPI00262FD50D|nr:hypothetical protein [Flavobacterium sp.]